MALANGAFPTYSASINTTTTFTVTATNSAGTSQAASLQVQVGGGVAAGLSCTGFSKTLFVPWDWATAMTKVDTWNTQGGLGTNGILVVPFTPTAPMDNIVTQLSAVGYPEPNMHNSLRLAISTQPCDLNPPAPGGAQGATPTVRYVVGTAPISPISGRPTAVSLTPGVQYYLNVAGRMNVTNDDPDGAQTCVPGTNALNYPNCEVRLSVQKPLGH